MKNEENQIEYRVKLIECDNLDKKLQFEKFCEDNRIQIQKKVRFTKYMYIYRVSLNSLKKYHLLKNFEGLDGVEKASLIKATLD